MPEENAEVTEEQLVQAASQYDAAIEAGEEPEVTIEEQPESDEGDVTEIKEQMQEEAEQEEQASDAEEQSSSEEPEPEEKAEEKPVSKYEKNRRRQSEAWEKINSQKEEAKKREAELEKREKELEEQHQKIAANKGYRDEDGHSADDFEKAAKEFDQEGESDLAAAARKRAEEYRGREKEAQEQSSRAEVEEIRKNQQNELREKHPELNDPNSELFKEVASLMATYPVLQFDPYGLKAAVDVAQLRQNSKEADSLRERVGELEQLVNKYEKKTSVGGGFTTAKVSVDKNFDDMDIGEQDNYLLQAAMAHDDNL